MKATTAMLTALDGGGARGIFQMTVLKRFIDFWGVNQSDFFRKCSVISGTSVGGVSALALAKGMTVDDILPFFTTVAPWIFTIRTAADVAIGSINSSLQSNRPNTAQKLVMMGNDDPFYAAVNPASNYGSSRFYSELENIFGSTLMSDLTVPVLIPAYDKTGKTFRLFSNIGTPPYVGRTALVRDVAFATTAAPIYFPSATFGGLEYLDGGLFQNNPAGVGLTAAKNIKPSARKYCILSIGTGLGAYGFGDTPDYRAAKAELVEKGAQPRVIDTLQSLFETINIAITGCQEAVRTDIKLRSNQYNPMSNEYQLTYQDQLDEATWDTALDNTDAAFLDYLVSLANSLFDSTIQDATAFRTALES